MKGHPKGLLVLALTNMGERFGYYTMLAILVLYIKAKFGLSSSEASFIYGTFLALVYFLPLFGGRLADNVIGYGKTIIIGIFVMFAGYALLAVPSEPNLTGKIMMYGALLLIAAGTGFFKGNLQTLVGNLYESDLYKGKQNIAFSIFYMFINIGAFFAPGVADSINNAVLRSENFTYDASIPNNYVKLNDFKVLKVLDLSEEETFKADAYAKSKKAPETKNDSASVLAKAKSKAKVIFRSEETKYLFDLKAAGLAQLTASQQIGDPAKQVSKKDYQLLGSRDTKDKQAIAALKEKINSVQITDTKLYGDPNDPDKFSVNFAQNYVDNSLSKSYNMAFGVACISLIMSLLIFLLFRKTWKHSDKTHKQQVREAKETGSDVVVLSKEQVKERMIALLLVFFVVIFFWMSFHQNGSTMTIFAQNYTASEISPLHNMMFSLFSILPFIVIIYGIYIATLGLFGGRKRPLQGLIIAALGLAGLAASYFVEVKNAVESIKITPQIFQQFNPLFIVILTPVSVALFHYLASKNREPSAPRKIGYGMLIAAVGFIIMLIASFGLAAPSDIGDGLSDVLISPNWLISSYFVLTLAELFLSPMGMAFVAKVAPPQYKGMMQGGWLAATAIGNLMVGVMAAFWEKLQLYAFWGVLVICCLLSAAFIFSIMKRLEKATE
ncbi:MAG: peptide MFS transporter [Prevotellaceae bacterium]|jgi:POT family proton-dependent oligopeptide transporter|nr:peptide MFS transporter [Prevotellaceae bacterium]